MQPRVETIPSKNLLGKRLTMSFVNDRTGELWGSFMRERKNIAKALSEDLICMQVFDPSIDVSKEFNPQMQFEKWATKEVADLDHVPDGLEPYLMPGGLYAVFLYKGDSAAAGSFFNYIYGTWIPASAYEVDKREHFQVMGAGYKNNDPDSEEEFWVPVKLKNK
jgi:AraC family transcriptional regulator